MTGSLFIALTELKGMTEKTKRKPLLSSPESVRQSDVWDGVHGDHDRAGKYYVIMGVAKLFGHINKLSSVEMVSVYAVTITGWQTFQNWDSFIAIIICQPLWMVVSKC